jgi:hypothetical protein
MPEESAAVPEKGKLYTLAGLAETLPDFPREAIARAIDSLLAAGVIAEEKGPGGERLFRYTNPERYKLIDVPVIRQPGPDFGKR